MSSPSSRKKSQCDRCDCLTDQPTSIEYVCNEKLCPSCLEEYKDLKVIVYNRIRNPPRKSFKPIQYAHRLQILSFRQEPHSHPRTVKLLDNQQQPTSSRVEISPEVRRRLSVNSDFLDVPTLFEQPVRFTPSAQLISTEHSRVGGKTNFSFHTISSMDLSEDQSQCSNASSDTKLYWTNMKEHQDVIEKLNEQERKAKAFLSHITKEKEERIEEKRIMTEKWEAYRKAKHDWRSSTSQQIETRKTVVVPHFSIVDNQLSQQKYPLSHDEQADCQDETKNKHSFLLSGDEQSEYVKLREKIDALTSESEIVEIKGLYDINVTRKDFQMLMNEKGWLSDVIINAFAAMLSNGNKRVFTVVKLVSSKRNIQNRRC